MALYNMVQDQKWAWKSVLGAFMSHAMTMSIDISYSLIFKEIQSFYDVNATITSSIFGLISGFRLLMSPVAVVLIRLFGCDKVTIFGGGLISIGLFIGSCSPHIVLFMISCGVLVGIGFSLSFTATLIILSENFNKKKSLAFGIASSGVSVGHIIFSHIFAAIKLHYEFRSLLMILSAFSLHLVVIGLMYCRPKNIKHIYLKVNLELLLSSKEVDLDIQKKTSRHYGKLLKDSCFNIQPLKNLNFLIFSVGTGLLVMGYLPWMIFIVDFITTTGNVSINIAVLSFTVEGICQMICRILSGVLFDIPAVRKYRGIYCSIMCFTSGLSCILLVLCHPSIYSYLLISMLRGCSLGVFIAQNIVVLGDICDPSLLSMSIGIITFMKGLGSIFGPTLSGFFRDYFESYFQMFIFLGSIQICAGSLILLANIRSCRNQLSINRAL